MFIEYDDNGMPRRIQFADGNVTEYVYTATGRKLRAVYYTAVPGITVGSGETHQLTASEILSKDSIDYLGSLTLVNGVLGQYFFPGGYCSLNDVNASGGIGWHYYNYDHLDNNREVVSESGTLEQVRAARWSRSRTTIHSVPPSASAPRQAQTPMPRCSATSTTARSST